MSTSLGLRAGLLWRQYGWPPVLGLVLLAIGALLHGRITPALNAKFATLDRQNAALARPRPVSAPSARVKTASLFSERKQAFERTLVAPQAVPETLAQLFAAAAAAKVTLAQGDYKNTPEKQSGYSALRIVLPVKSSYPQLRAFVDAALAQNPALALEEITFKRETVDASTGEARVRFVLYMREPGSSAEAPTTAPAPAAAVPETKAMAP